MAANKYGYIADKEGLQLRDGIAGGRVWFLKSGLRHAVRVLSWAPRGLSWLFLLMLGEREYYDPKRPT